MTLDENSRFVVKVWEDLEDEVSYDDQRLFEYTRLPLSSRQVLRHKASGYYFADTETFNATSNYDRAIHIRMKSSRIMQNCSDGRKC